MEDGYLVRTRYNLLVDFSVVMETETNREKALSMLGKANAPFKIKVFGQSCFWNRICLKNQLLRKGILNPNVDLNCVLCASEVETLFHLML